MHEWMRRVSLSRRSIHLGSVHALALEVRNPKDHRRIFLSHNRSFVEQDFPSDLENEIVSSYDEMLKVCRLTNVGTISRVGLRQWFAFTAGPSFDTLRDMIINKLLASNGKINAALGARINDVAYVVDLVVERGWNYNLRLGPMTHDQWFQLVLYEPGIYEAPDAKEPQPRELIKSNIPSLFIFVDIDSYKLNCSPDEALAFVAEARAKVYEAASGLVAYTLE